jgi:hypothetical protein
VQLFRIKKDGSRKLVGEDVLNPNGNRKFTVPDNSRKFRKFVAMVLPNDAQNGDETNRKRVR